MTIDTNALRALASVLQQQAVEQMSMIGPADDAALVRAAASEIDRLTTALAASPHSNLCSYMVDHFHEPCSCWKADPSPSAGRSVDDALDAVTSLTVAGPHGRVLGLPCIRRPRLEFREAALTIHYDNPET
jgi:hypothetical protein